MSMRGNTRDYPTCDHHEVRCPQCGRSLADKNHHIYPMEHARYAKHCGVPCYGTAWYTHKPAEPKHWSAMSPSPAGSQYTPWMILDPATGQPRLATPEEVDAHLGRATP